MSEKMAGGAAQASRILRNYMAKFMRAQGIPAQAAKGVRGTRINFSFPDNMDLEALAQLRSRNPAYHMPPGIDRSNIVMRSTKGTGLGPVNVLSHELGHAADAEHARVPGWREAFSRLSKETQEDVLKHDLRQGTSLSEAEPYAEGHRRMFLDWMKGDPARLEKLKLLNKRLKHWQLGSHRGEKNIERILKANEKTAVATAPKDIFDKAQMLLKHLCGGKNCLNGAMALRHRLDKAGVKSRLIADLRKAHFGVQPISTGHGMAHLTGNPFSKMKFQYDSPSYLSMLERLKIMKPVALSPKLASPGLLTRRPDNFTPSEATAMKLSIDAQALKRLLLIQAAKKVAPKAKPAAVDGHAVGTKRFKIAMFSRLLKAAPKAPVVPPVGREVSLAKIIARLRQRSPQHAQRLQEMLRKRGLRNTADEMESGGFRAAPGMDVTKQAALEKAAAIISQGPDDARKALAAWKKLLDAKDAAKAVAPAKPSGAAKALKKKPKKPKGLYGTPTGHGTAAFRFGD